MEPLVRSHYLTRPPDPDAFYTALFSVLALLVASVVYWADLFHAGTWMTAIPQKVFDDHQYWRLWTALFAHVDLEHLLSNSVLFFAFGYVLNGYFGGWVFPGLPLLFGGLLNFFVLKTMPPTTALLGVSGVVYWVGAAWLTLYVCLDVRTPIARRLIKGIGVALILFIPETFHPSTSYLSHFLGFSFGVVWALGYYLYHRRRFLSFVVTEPPDDEEIQTAQENLSLVQSVSSI